MRLSARNLVDLFEDSCARYAMRPALGTKHAGTWTWTSYRELEHEVDKIRAGLGSLGVEKGDVVAIVSANRVEWAAVCYASFGLEATFVPMYEQQRPEDWRFILQDCGAKVVIAGSSAIFEQLIEQQAQLPALQHVLGMHLDASDARSVEAIRRIGAGAPVPARSPEPSSVAGFVYTSGTTGKPKGVMLTHANIASNVSAISEVFPLEPTDRTLSFLPWAHAFGQLELHYVLSQGGSLALNDELPHLLENLAEVRPTVLVAVPRIFHRIHALVQEQIAARPALVRRLFDDGVRSATKRAHGERLGLLERVELTVDDALMFKKIRDRFGGRLRFVISASAALSPTVAELIDAVGLPVFEGYGLTETGPAATVNTPAHRKIGSVGRPLPGVRIVIDEAQGDRPGHGEIIVYGANVMPGYHGRPDESAAALTADGGLRTGDLGRIDEDGFLFVTGRIKELFKLENGKYVTPTPLEESIKLSPYVTNVVLHGANRPYVVAIVAPNAEALQRWALSEGHTLGPLDRDPAVRDLLMREIAGRGAGFPSFSVPRKVLVAPADFSIADGLLTPTLKVKRNVVEARFASALDALYREPLPVEVEPRRVELARP